MLEDLDEERARDVTVRSDLGKEDLEVITRHTVAVVLRHEPRATRGIVHDNVAARFERQDPGLGRAFHRADLALVCRTIRRLEHTDRHPTVVFQFREEAEQQGVDGIGGRGSQRILIEGRRRGEVHREDGIATHRGHNVIGVDAFHVDAVGGHTGEGAGVMLGQHLDGEAIRISLSIRGTREDKASEKGGQTVHASAIWVGQS